MGKWLSVSNKVVWVTKKLSAEKHRLAEKGEHLFTVSCAAVEMFAGFPSLISLLSGLVVTMFLVDLFLHLFGEE